MARWFLMLIAVVAVASFFTEPAAAQRGIPIPGAKITFSTNADGSSPKTSFTSSEYIYGRLDLGGRTMYDAFGLKNLGANAKYYSIHYHLNIIQPGKEAWEHDWHNGKNYTLVTKEDAQKTVWNFDVLPDPAKISTLIGAIDDDLSYFNSAGGFYSQWYNADSARSKFPQNGTYTIDIVLFGDSYDDWGKSTGEDEKFPTVSAKFAFQFSGTDGQTLVANAVKAKDSVEAAKNRREMLHAMPDWWFKASTPPEPKLAAARLVPLIKGFIGQWNLTYMKHMIVQYSRAALGDRKEQPRNTGIPHGQAVHLRHLQGPERQLVPGRRRLHARILLRSRHLRRTIPRRHPRSPIHRLRGGQVAESDGGTGSKQERLSSSVRRGARFGRSAMRATS